MLCRLISFTLISFLLNSCAQKVYEIAFVSDRDGNLDIYSVKSDTTNLKQLTATKNIEYSLLWAKNGNIIYYTYFRSNGRQINSLDIIADSIYTILNDSTVVTVLDVSNDNSKLLITSSEHNKKGEIYLYDISSKARTRITKNDFTESGAKFSPDEKSIVTSIQTSIPDTVNHGGNAEIFSINLSNLKISPLTNLKGFNALPSWSPDGKYIAFHNCNNGQCDIYRMNADGSQLYNLTKDNADNKWPRWTPDGKWIAFSRTEKGNSDIYFISANGKKIKPVIVSAFRDEIAEIKPTSSKR